MTTRAARPTTSRLVRKHDHYFALTGTGDIVSGVSHVDPELSPYGPPPTDGLRRAERGHAASGGGRATPAASDGPSAPRTWTSRRPPSRSGPAGPWGWRAGPRCRWPGPGTGPGWPAWSRPPGRRPSPRWRAARPPRPRCWPRRCGDGDPAGRVAGRRAARRRGPGGHRPGHGRRPAPGRADQQGCGLRGRRAAGRRQLPGPAGRGAGRGGGGVLHRAGGGPLAAGPAPVRRAQADRNPPAGLAAAGLAARGWSPVARPGPLFTTRCPVLGARKPLAAPFEHAWNNRVSPGQMLYTGSPEGAGVLAAQRGDDPFAVTTQIRILWR